MFKFKSIVDHDGLLKKDGYYIITFIHCVHNIFSNILNDKTKNKKQHFLAGAHRYLAVNKDSF